jgi:hypothetical protein
MYSELAEAAAKSSCRLFYFRGNVLQKRGGSLLSNLDRVIAGSRM